jgi:glycerophosphoryl diester phosphodiesterase
MKIFGHRGAAGLALENSKESIIKSLRGNVAAVEFDVHRTADMELVVIHDHTTGRVAEKDVEVHRLTLAELQSISLNNGQHILSLDELFAVIGNQKPIMIDIKDTGCGEVLLSTLDRHPSVIVYVTSFVHDNLQYIRKARPDIPIYVLEHYSPFEIIHTARRLQATGISLNMWLMNPLTYRLAKRYGLDLLVYTVNSPLLMRFFKKLYPDVTLYTDHPERVPKSL